MNQKLMFQPKFTYSTSVKTEQKKVGFWKGLKNKLLGVSDKDITSAIEQSADMVELKKILTGYKASSDQISKVVSDVCTSTKSKILDFVNDYIKTKDSLPSYADISSRLYGVCPRDYGRDMFSGILSELKSSVETEIAKKIKLHIQSKASLPLLSEVQSTVQYPRHLVEEILLNVLATEKEKFFNNLTLTKHKISSTARAIPSDVVMSLMNCVDQMRQLQVFPSCESAGDSTITEIIREYTRLSSNHIPALLDSYIRSQSNLISYARQNIEDSQFSNIEFAKLAHTQTIYIMCIQIAMLIDLSKNLKMKFGKETVCRVGVALSVVTLQILHNECPLLKIPKMIYQGIVGIGDFICKAPKDLIKTFLPKKIANIIDDHRVAWNIELGKLTYQRMLGIGAAMNMMYCFRAGNAFVKADKFLTDIDQCSEIFGSLSPIPIDSEKELILRLYREDLYYNVQ